MAQVHDRFNRIQLLGEKKCGDRLLELPLFLFESCNLGCSFCFLTHTQLASPETIRKTVEVGKQAFDIPDYDCIAIKFGGGELFADFIPDSYFDLYFECAQELFALAKEKGKSCYIKLLTNLVHKKENRERVMALLKRFKDNGMATQLLTSFDFTNRFTTPTKLAIFKENFDFYKPYIDAITVCATSHFLRVLRGKDLTRQDIAELEVFDELIKSDVEMAVDYYMPSATDEGDKVNALGGIDECWELNMLIREKYPKLLVQFGTNTTQICHSIFEVRKCEVSRNCQSCTYTLRERIEPKDDMLVDYVKRHGCFVCKYYEKCSLGCSMFFHRVLNNNDYSFCLKKRLYELDEAEGK